jgi:hypothetical protein
MGKSDLLRVRDVRDAYRLIGECRDLGGEPALWQTRILEGLGQLVGAAAGAGGEGIWARPVHPVQPFSAFDTGFDAGGRERFRAYMREIGPVGDPIFRALRDVPGVVATRTRSQLVSNAEWYRSTSFNEYRKLCGVDHCLTSICRVSDGGAVSVITAHRRIGERDFSHREVRLLEFFHGELREAGRGASRHQPHDCPSVRDGPVPSFRRAEPEPTSGPRPAALPASRLDVHPGRHALRPPVGFGLTSAPGSAVAGAAARAL